MNRGKKIRSDRAVTLTALVITIIVLIILAAVSVLGVFGENGILKSAITAKVDTEVATYTEELKAIEVQTRTQQMKSNLEFVYLKAFENNVNNHTMFAEAREVGLRSNDTVLRIITKEGYIFYIKDDEVEGVLPGGIDGETEDPGDLYPSDGKDIPEGASVVTFAYSTRNLTKEDVKVTVTVVPDPTQQIQYRINSGAWKNIDNNAQINMTECGTIYVRLHNGYTGGRTVSTVIDWIDKVAPRMPSVTYSSTENSIEVIANTVDAAQTSKSACSGNVQYSFRITGDGVTNTSETPYQTSGNFKFDSSYGLVENGIYTIYVKAKDGVGNETKEYTVSASTTRVPDGKGNITITADGGTSESSWTKGPVNVTVSNTGAVNGYDLVYSLDGTNYELVPSDGKIPVITENGTTVYAAFQNSGKAHGTPEKLTLNYIDTEAPEVTAEITKVTSSTIGVSAIAADTKDNGGKSGISGVKTYMYSCDGGANYVTGNGSTYEFTGLKDGKDYTVMVKVIDKAGNEGTTTAKNPDGSTTVTTDKVPDLPNENIQVKFNKNPNDAYVKLLKASATITGDVGNYTVQASIDGGNTWETYTSGTEKEFNKNGSLSIRLSDGTNAGKAVSLDITNVDNIGPEVKLSENTVEEQTFKVKMTGTDKKTTEYAASGVQGFYWTYKENSGDYREEKFLEAKNNINTLMISELEGGTYIIKVYAVDNLGNKGEEKTLTFEIEKPRIPGLNDGPVNANMKFVYNPDPKDGITAGPVNVNVELSEDIQTTVEELNLKLYYITDTISTWTKLPETGVNFSENGTISVRLQEDETGALKATGGAATANVLHIDTLAPNSEVTYKIPTYSKDTIYVQAFGNDSNDGKSAVSGIRGMQFQYAVETNETASNDWSNWSQEQKATDTGSAFYIINGLSAGTKYRIRVKLIDNVGKETVSTSTRTITTVASGSSGTGSGDSDIPENIDNKIVYLYNGKSEGEWTKDKVKVTLNFNSINPDNYIVRYRTDGIVDLSPEATGWSIYENTSSGFDVENNCLIAAQLISKDNGNMGDIYWGKVYWIDSASPEVFSLSATPGVASVTVKGKSEKDLGNDGYAGSGIASYEVAYFIPSDSQVINDNSIETMWNSNQLSGKTKITELTDDGYAEYKFIDLNPGTEYVFMMRALDKVGNASKTAYTTREANNISVLSNNDFSYKYYDKSGNEMTAGSWTNSEVKLVIDVTSDAGQSYLRDGCKLIVNFDSSSVEYEQGGITITNGTQVYVGLKYGNVTPTSLVQIEPARIDKTKPLEYELTSEDIRKSSKSLTITMPIDKLVDAGSSDFNKDFMSGINTSKFKFEVYYRNTLKGSSGDEPIESNTWTCHGLEIEMPYYVKVIYYDNAGNAQETPLVQTSTAAMVETMSSNLTIDVKPQTKGTKSVSDIWGNDGAVVTITASEEYAHYHIKYSYDEDLEPENWDEYTGSIFVDENTYIYAQLQDDDNVGSGSVSARISCIDKIQPIVQEESFTAKTKPNKAVTITANMSDEGGSGIYGYFLTTSKTLTVTTIGSRTWIPCSGGSVDIAIPREYTAEAGITTLYLWIADYAGNISEKAKTITINVAATSDGTWNDTKKVNSPQLFEGLIPVVYDDKGNTVEATDLSDWYDYDNGKWANAITVDETDGMVTGYYVWIPRFAYKFDSGRYTNTMGEISVKFLKNKTNYDQNGIQISKTLTDYTSTVQPDYVVHPSFTASGSENNRTYYNGEWSDELYGYWVSKFEAGKQNATKSISGNTITTTNGNAGTVSLQSTGKKYTIGGKTSIVSDVHVTRDGENYGNDFVMYPVFIPCTESFYEAKVGDIYTLVQCITNGSTNSIRLYGFDKDETNSHLMKNSEWGAVAYLTHSNYGINYDASNETHVWVNNYSNFVTGLTSANSWSDTNTSSTSNVKRWNSGGQLGSSTGTIYGVYDLMGGREELVAAYDSSSSLPTNYRGTSSYNISKVINGELKNTFIKLVNIDTTIDYSNNRSDANFYGKCNTRYSTCFPYGYLSENRDGDGIGHSFR